MSAQIYVEGGGDSKELGIRLQEAFGKLFKRMGFAQQRRMPSIRWGGGRERTFDKFTTACRTAPADCFVAMLVDSEDPVADIEATWNHLRSRDRWERPHGADDEQVLLMVTCMETWIVSDRVTLRSHYGAKLQESALPALHDMESRGRAAMQDALSHATRDCGNAYRKGKRSFEIVAKLDPATLKQHLPSFARVARVLDQRL